MSARTSDIICLYIETDIHPNTPRTNTALRSNMRSCITNAIHTLSLYPLSERASDPTTESRHSKKTTYTHDDILFCLEQQTRGSRLRASAF